MYDPVEQCPAECLYHQCQCDYCEKFFDNRHLHHYGVFHYCTACLIPILETAILEKEAEGIRLIARFLDACGDKSKCAGCGQDIWWFIARNSKKWPVTAKGQNHFIDCVKFADFKKDR